MSIDQELLASFLAGSQGNKGVSSMLGNLDNPFLLYLAGQYLPPVSASNAGGVSSRYVGNENYPSIQELLTQIQEGADEFQYGTAVKGLVAGGRTDGLESGEFERLAKNIYEEQTGTGSSKKKNPFTEAGYADPTEIYTLENLPNRPGINAFLQQVAARQQMQSRDLERLSQTAEEKRKQVAPLYDKEFTTQELVNYLRTDPEGKKLAKQRGIDMSKVSSEGDVYSWKGTKRPKRSVLDPRNFTEAITSDLYRFAEDLGRTVTGGRTKTISEAVGGTGKLIQGREKQKEEYSAAASRAKQVEDQMKLEQYQAEKFAKAYLGRLAERGITPLKDQMTGVLGFLSQNK